MKRIKLTFALLAIAIAAVAATALGSSASASTPSRTGGLQNIVDTANAAGNFTTLVSLLTKAGLADTLANGGPFTVFAPTDAAFAKVPKATLDALAANPDLLKAVLLYHVVPGTLTAADVSGAQLGEDARGIEASRSSGSERVGVHRQREGDDA